MAEAHHRLPRPAPRLRLTAGGGHAEDEATPASGARHVGRSRKDVRRQASGAAAPAGGGLRPEATRQAVHAAAQSGQRLRADLAARGRRMARARRGRPLEEAAGHLLAAEPDGRDWVVGALCAAARLAAARGDSERTVAYLRRALREPLRPGRRSCRPNSAVPRRRLTRQPQSATCARRVGRRAAGDRCETTAGILKAFDAHRPRRSGQDAPCRACGRCCATEFPGRCALHRAG